jgi:hypothetical protein
MEKQRSISLTGNLTLSMGPYNLCLTFEDLLEVNNLYDSLLPCDTVYSGK